VITVPNWAQPGDLSHFESFSHYHATFYRQLEALSVTPYSTGAPDRAFTGVLVSAIRQAGADYNRNESAQQMQPAHAIVQAALAVLPVRAREAGTGGAGVRLECCGSGIWPLVPLCASSKNARNPSRA
jgi:hypothetical protein